MGHMKAEVVSVKSRAAGGASREIKASFIRTSAGKKQASGAKTDDMVSEEYYFKKKNEFKRSN